MKDKILVVDDEAGIRSSLQGILEDEGFSIKTTESGELGLDLMKSENFDLVLLDVWLPEMNGIQVLEKIQTLENIPQVVMISGHGSVESAVKATKLGAFDFLEKPLTLEKVVLTVKNALKQRRLEEENILLRERIQTKYELIGKSPAIKKTRESIKKAAASNSRVLISGEAGTGKELVARLIHQLSNRRQKRFFHFNIAAIPENLIEKELFGYTEDVFPDTEKTRKGKLLMAEGGVLFLEEIEELSLQTQSKLIRLIDEGCYEPLGSSESVGINTRVMASTTADLKNMIAEGRFLKELLFKLNVIPIHLPPLRERKEDIPLLIEHYLRHFALADGKKPKTMDKEAMRGFVNYSWPGNVSELINVIERFVIMVSDEEINDSHLSLLVEPIESESIPGTNTQQTLDRARELFEKEFIHRSLVRNEWNVTGAASELGLEEAELQARIKALNITFLE